MGPIEYLVIGFEGNQFTGEIAPELAALRDAGTIRVLDLLIIGRDLDANVFVAEVGEIADLQQHVDVIQEDLGQWFSQEDIDSIADDIAAGDTVALLLIEHLWAQSLAESIRRANGALLAQTYIPGELVDEVRALLKNGAKPDSAAPPEDYRRAA